MSMWRIDGTQYEDGKVTAIYVSHELHGLDRAKFVPDRQHGEWIGHFDGNEWYWCCKSCKTQWYEEDLYMGGNEFPDFCPKCGAKMVQKGR